MIEVVPDKRLISYWKLANELLSGLNNELEEFNKRGEWPYIQSDINYNILLLQRLLEADLLPDGEIKICDCGIGLGTIMYDLYLQSKNIERSFKFYGVEKHEPYINLVNNNLKKYWGSDLTIFNCDLMQHDYSGYNFLWIFTPYSVSNKLLPFFKKVLTEVKPGSIMIGLDKWRVVTYGDDELAKLLTGFKFIGFDGLAICIKL